MRLGELEIDTEINITATKDKKIAKFIVHKQSERLRVSGRKALYNKKKDSELFEDIKD